MPLHRALSALLAAALPVALAGCAIHIVSQAPPDRQSDDTRTVITGRVNYVIDGQFVLPYRGTRPGWPAPVMEAVSLRTGEVHAFPAVDAEQGRFRWQLEPGAYVVTRIGVGTFTDETYIAWPRVALCVPRAPGRIIHIGHLRLEGTRYDEGVTLSTGTSYRSRGVRFQFRVDDEMNDAPSESKRLMRHLPEMPTGDLLQQQWKADAAGLARRVCGDLPA
jgi:hypothetical protein